MADDLTPIMDRFTKDLEAWLDAPSETSGKIADLKKQIEAMKGELGAENMAAALKAFDEGDKQLKRQRQKQAAETIAEALRPLGIRLKPESPAKKQRRRRGSPSNGEAAGSQKPQTSAVDQSASSPTHAPDKSAG